MASRNSRLKLILGTVMVFILAAVAVLYIHFKQQDETAGVTLPPMATKAIMSLARVHQTATKDGVVQWELNADSAELDSDTGRMVLRAPQVRFFLEDGTQVQLTAEQGELNTHSNNMQMRGNVQVRNDRYTLTTDALAYQHADRILRTDAPVQIVGQMVEIQAAAMTYDLKTDRAQFSGQVKGMIYEGLPI
jgi:lipopolysaccharide export system protein LptC